MSRSPSEIFWILFVAIGIAVDIYCHLRHKTTLTKVILEFVPRELIIGALAAAMYHFLKRF